jgi:methionine sulfoxide reductase heme-binding subunit
MAVLSPVRALKPVVFAICLLPLVWLVWRGATGDLGANPIEAVVRSLGDWSLRMLLAALAVTPLRRLTGWSALARLRRMLGLFAFAYVTLHLLAYVALDQFFDWPSIWADVVKRRYILIGMVNFAMLAALAATSTDSMVRRVGARRWRALHRLVYAAAPLAVLHYFMMVKTDIRTPLIYGAVAAALLGVRLLRRTPQQTAALNRVAHPGFQGDDMAEDASPTSADSLTVVERRCRAARDDGPPEGATPWRLTDQATETRGGPA